VCDNWFHPACLKHHQVPESTDDSFVCPLCFDSKAEAYLSNQLWGGAGSDTFASECFSDLLSSQVNGGGL
jgi:hypothetical protein